MTIDEFKELLMPHAGEFDFLTISRDRRDPAH